MNIKYFVLLLMANSFSSIANECDCTQITGSCQGSIHVSPTTSPTGLGGAELYFRANAKQCAKIEYWVDNTPTLTILANGKSAEDSVWSAEKKPFKPYRITYKSCVICKTEAQKNKENEQKKLKDADTQSAVENLVNEARSNGSLEPSSYSSSSSTSSEGTSNDSIDAIISLQSQLSETQKKINSSGNKNNRNIYAEGCTNRLC